MLTLRFSVLFMPFASCLEDALSINQSTCVECPTGQLGPNRQESQFSEFKQTRFASYTQSIPQGNHHMHLGLHKVIKSATVQQCCRRSTCCDLIWLYAGQSNTNLTPHSPMTCTLDTACLSLCISLAGTRAHTVTPDVLLWTSSTTGIQNLQHQQL